MKPPSLLARRGAAPRSCFLAGVLLALRCGIAQRAVAAGAAPPRPVAAREALGAPPVFENRSAPPPCAADFSAILPDVPVTEADLRKANYEAFVRQVAEDEDRRVARGANRMLRRLLDVRAARHKELEEVEALRARASRRKEEARRAAEEQIAEAVSEALRGVAVKAEAAGRRAQLADDKRLIAAAAEKQAVSSDRSASSVRTRAVAEGRLADVAEAAAVSLERDWRASQNRATGAAARAARVAMKAKVLDDSASALASSAAEVATAQISGNIEAYARMADISKASVKHAMETERALGCRDCNRHDSRG